VTKFDCLPCDFEMLKVICTPFEPCEMDDITMVARAEQSREAL